MCRTCGQVIPVERARELGHEVVYRLNSVDGPDPVPFMMLHVQA